MLKQKTPSDDYRMRVAHFLNKESPHDLEDLPKITLSDSAKKLWIEEFNRGKLCAFGKD